MNRLNKKNCLFIILPIVLMVLVNIFHFVNYMTLVWKNPIDSVLASSFPVSLLFLLLAFIFYRQTNDEKYRDIDEVADSLNPGPDSQSISQSDPRKIRLTSKKKIYLIVGTLIIVYGVSIVNSVMCQIIYNSRRQHDDEIVRAIGEACKATYEYYQDDSYGIKSSKQAESYEIGFQKLQEGVDILTWSELTSDTKEMDSFAYKLEIEFERELFNGADDYVLGRDGEAITLSNLKEHLFFANKDSELYVYMTDTVVVAGIKNPVKSLDKDAGKLWNCIAEKQNVPELLFYVVDDSDNPKHNTFAVDTFGQIYESKFPQNDYYKLNTYMNYLADGDFYREFRKVGEIDDFETYEVYQIFTSNYSDATHSFKGDRDELLKRLNADFFEGFKAGYNDEYLRPVSEDVSILDMNVIGIYTSEEYYSITNDELIKLK